ncbi:lipoprotein [Spiroplasma chrysopicola]|uniref:Lipoprotein n=1 Tax=Spiroplasma chrysopicola DF-1 TaxID=1276227 RepID=R4UGY7_9MOLU|nr:lipoprotein [Spiroplasma chrysopicola]AGM25430.1 hypothetical protein SCHRY_v1c08550 [Spiroplasma chrysopicola DF-1]
MKKLLSLLGVISLVGTSVTPVIGCGAKPVSQETIHDKIKKSLQHQIVFDDDWIIDYSQSDKNIKSFISSASNFEWSFLNKLITDLVMKQLVTDIPNLLELYPNFSLSAQIANRINIIDDLRNSIFKNENYNFSYDVGYNLDDLKDISVKQIQEANPSNPPIINGFLTNYDGSTFGQYKIFGSESQNQISLRINSFIADNQKRLNYLTKMLNGTSAIVANQASYHKLLLMPSGTMRIGFSSNDFPNHDLIKTIYNDNSLFENYKKLILSNIKKDALNSNQINFLLKYMPTIFDDIDLDISLNSAFLQSDIEQSDNLKHIYGSKYYEDGLLILNVKTTLKYKDISATTTIDEQLAFGIVYE